MLRWLVFDKGWTTKRVFGKQLLNNKVFHGQKVWEMLRLILMLLIREIHLPWERSTAFSPDPVESTAHPQNPIHRYALHLRYTISCLEDLRKTTKNLQRGYQIHPTLWRTIICVLCVLCSVADPGFVGPEA